MITTTFGILPICSSLCEIQGQSACMSTPEHKHMWESFRVVFVVDGHDTNGFALWRCCIRA